MFTRTAVALAIVLGSVTACLTDSAHADDFLGGEGGGFFGTINCPRGTVVVGLGGRSGAVIDTMQLICGKGRGSPDLDILDPRPIGPSTGGGAISAVCPIFSAVTAIQVNAREHDGNIVVSQIVLSCRATLDGGDLVRRVFGGGGGDDAGNQECPADHYAAGFAGRSGTFIDAVGITTCRHRRSLN